MRASGGSIRILLLEDSDFDAELVIRELRKGGLSFGWHRVQTRHEYLQALRDYRPDLILVDYRLPDFDGGQAIVMAKEVCPGVPTIVVTGAVGEDVAVELFKKGATDFVLKDRMSGRLAGVVDRAIAEASNRVARRQAEEQQAQLSQDLQRLATRDPLTGVASRSLLLERLQEALAKIDAQAPDTAVFTFKIQHLKQINITYGVSFTDEVLVETARRLSGLCGEHDLIGALGVGEFILLVKRDHLEKELPSLRKRIQGYLEQPFRIRNLDVTVVILIGGVVLKDPGDTTTQVLAQCDEAVEQGMQRDQPTVMMADDTIIRKLKQRSLLDSDIQEAVQAKSLFRFFQPIVSLETGRIHGAEGLLRFRQKDGMILAAPEFMDALIRTGSLSIVDEAVISDFLTSGRELVGPLLRRSGFRFSFNIAPGILANVGYAAKILAQIASESALPSSFTLEILEEGLMPLNETVRENLSEFQKAGVFIAVDDFGIGYSNLIRLSRLPINELKIPRELVVGIRSGDAKLKAVLETAIAIAKKLDLIIVAEGVEDPAEADYLRGLGCEYAQGYLYGKAMPLEQLVALVEAQGAE